MFALREASGRGPSVMGMHGLGTDSSRFEKSSFRKKVCKVSFNRVVICVVVLSALCKFRLVRLLLRLSVDHALC